MIASVLRPALLTAALAYGGCQGSGPTAGAGAEKTSPPPRPKASGSIELPTDSPMLKQVEIGEIVEQELPVDEVVSPAKIEIDPSHYSQVLLPAAGRVMEVKVRVGDTVKAGDVLLILDSPDADAAIADFKQSEADVTAANAALTKARTDRDRVRGLFEHDAVARKEVDNVEAAYAASRAELVRAQAERQQALRRLKLLGLDGKKATETISVRAPISGKVLELKVAPGEYRSDTAQPLMTIADLSLLIVAADVAENLIRFINLGEPVQIELVAFPKEVLSAKVVRIADMVDPTTRTIEVHAALPNPEGRFRPEMFGSVRHSHATVATPALPQSAVLQRDGKDIILVEQGAGRFEIRPIKIGTRAGGKVGIAEGAKVGERVVIDGGMLLLPPE